MWRLGLHYRNLITLVFFILKLNSCVSQEFSIEKNIVDFSPSGPRGTAMGGAQTAIANDTYSLGWNPAGLVSIENAKATFSGMLDFGDIRIAPPNDLSDFHNYSVNQRGNGSLNYLGFVLPVNVNKRKFVTAIVFRNQSNLHKNVSYNISDKRNEYNQLWENYNNGGVYLFTGSVSAFLFPNLSFGFNTNIITGSSKQEIKDRFSTTADTVVAWEKWQNKFSGMSFDLGILWSPSNLISLGSKISFPSTINLTSIRYTNSNGKALKFEFDGFIKKNTQISYGFGLHLKANFIVAVDYDFRPFSKDNVFYGSEDKIDYFFDAHSVHVGVEYVVTAEDATLPLWIGYFNKPQQFNSFAMPDESQSPVNARCFTGGFGLRFQNISFGISFEYKTINYLTDFLGVNQPFQLKQSKVRVVTGIEINM